MRLNIVENKSLVSEKSLWLNTLIGVNVYSLWALVYPLIIGDVIDPLWGRYLAALPFAIPVIFYRPLKLTQKSMELLFVAYSSGLLVHHHYLTYINNTHPIYIAGTTLALTAISLLVTSLFSFVVIALVSIICVLTASAFHYTPNNLFWILATLTTITFGGLMLYFRLKLTSEAIEAKEQIEAQLVEIKKANEQIEKERARSIQASKMAALGEMAAGIAHEINNPLQIIRGQANAIERMANEEHGEKFEKEKLIEIAEKIIKTTKRITSIINGLRNFSSGDELAPFEETSLGSFLESALELNIQRFKHDGIEFTITPYDENQKLSIQTNQFAQVLVNLFNNAYDEVLNSPNPWVKLEIENDSQNLIFKIMDSGKGILPENFDKIFSPFFTTKGPKKGTGLGLSISKGIIEAHRGQIYVDKKSLNTCFVVKIPKLV